MNNYNPMFDYQRNNLLAQQQMIQNQLNQMNAQHSSFSPYPQPQQGQYFTKQVGSIDEAKAFPIDPNVVYMFPDTGTGKIYLKKLNTDNGKSEFYVYSPSLEGETIVDKNDPNEIIIKRLDDIEKSIGGIYESISKNANVKSNHEESYRNGSETVDSKNAKGKPSEIQSDKTND